MSIKSKRYVWVETDETTFAGWLDLQQLTRLANDVGVAIHELRGDDQQIDLERGPIVKIVE